MIRTIGDVQQFDLHLFLKSIISPHKNYTLDVTPKSMVLNARSRSASVIAIAFCPAYSFGRMTKTTDALRTIICAAGLGDLATVQRTLRKAPAAARDWRPIMEASYKGFASVVELLVKNGANVDAISSSERNRP